MIHYTYKRDGGRLISAAASSRTAAKDFLRSVFRPGENLYIFWPADGTGSKFTEQWTVGPAA